MVLVEGVAKRTTVEEPKLVGRVDNGKRCVIPDVPVARAMPTDLHQAHALFEQATNDPQSMADAVPLQRGDFVLVRISQSGAVTLNAIPLARTTVQGSAPFMRLALGMDAMPVDHHDASGGGPDAAVAE